MRAVGSRRSRQRAFATSKLNNLGARGFQAVDGCLVVAPLVHKKQWSTKMKSNSLGGILGISLLALSLGFGGSAARADDADTSPLQNIGSEPMASMIQGFEERIAGLEETVRTLSGISEHVTTKELCVADDTGAQTCVSKAQLDALLKLKMQLGQATFSPPAEQPSVAALEPPAIETPAADTTAPAVETAA